MSWMSERCRAMTRLFTPTPVEEKSADSSAFVEGSTTVMGGGVSGAVESDGCGICEQTEGAVTSHVCMTIRRCGHADMGMPPTPSQYSDQ